MNSSVAEMEGGGGLIAPLKTKRGREFLEYQDYLFNLEKVDR